MLSVGIIGLPNVGKSTLFNSLTSGEAQVSNYPFTTIDSNVGVVALPDTRLEDLSSLLQPEDVQPCFIQFIDIAGLVRGASRGEGLGNQFLGNIRSVDAVAHVVRCFQEADVSHVLGDVDAARDIDIVETELLLADLELMDRAIEKRVRTWKTSPRQFAAEESRFRDYREKLAAGTPLRFMEPDVDERRELKGLGLLTSKPVLLVANISEDELCEEDHRCVRRIRQSRIGAEPLVVSLSARIEEEILQLDPEERGEYMEALGLEESGLKKLVRSAFELLDLITFYTAVNNRLSAWAIPSGTPAPRAAAAVHSDMEKGFIRAQVASARDLIGHGSIPALHKLGLVKTEGKDYQVRDGDVVEFLFS